MTRSHPTPQRSSSPPLATVMPALLVAVLLALAAGCSGSSSKTTTKGSTRLTTGGGSGALTSSGSGTGGSKAFVDGANKACEKFHDARTAADEAADRQFERSTAQWGAAHAGGAAKAGQAELVAFGRLTAPSSLADDWKRYVQLEREEVKGFAAAQQAALDSDPSGYRDALSNASDLGSKLDALSKKLGLKACSGEALSSADARAAAEVVKKVYLTTEPSLCTDELTEGLVHQNYGSLQACEEAQTDPSQSNSPSVNVTSIQGADDVALVSFTFQPSPENVASNPSIEGQTLQGVATVYRQHGQWRLQHVDVKPPSGDTTS